MPHLNVDIRPSHGADFDAVDDLLGCAYPVLLAPDYRADLLAKALPIISRANPELLSSGTYFVAHQDGQLLGAGGWSRGLPGGGAALPDRGNIRHLVTAETVVRQGVGRALMQHILADAKRAGMGWMHCIATLTAVPFYHAMGFSDIGAIDVPLQTDLHFPAMEMQLWF
ncbi:GNAT family N-acetyltransferase [Aestuariibius sp. HNIBRBA575]|uniref:GNAT family N-acetyltransferase n=1 Tax=Aestuariibius sp. HNIBRBA575 TaxID=3233343 RepID=UPI0034A26D9E